MYYTHVPLSEADRRLYVGATQDLRRGIEQHGAGRVGSTPYRPPARLLRSLLESRWRLRRERCLRSGRGGRYLKQRLAGTLSSTRDTKLERR